MQKLFSGFAPANAQQWREQIVKDLKGGRFEDLVWHNPNGFDVKPFYTTEDLTNIPAPLFNEAGWEICEEIEVLNEKEGNARALKALNAGASSLHFIVKSRPVFNELLNGISIEHIELCFIVQYMDEGFIEAFHSYLSDRAIDPSKLKGGVCYDVIAYFVQSGQILSHIPQNSWIDASIYQNAGVTQGFELACAIAHAHEYLLRSKYPAPFRFTIGIGNDFFGEVAKLRALRKLWHLVEAEYKMDSSVLIHARSGEVNKSHKDAYTNMLRTTTEGMSAVAGGCNSLSLAAYNASFEDANDFGTRIARNQQLLLKEESYFDKVADPGAGAYYIENLTDEIAGKAWKEFKNIENMGGFIEALRAGYIQQRIKEQREKMLHDFRNGKQVLVGVNKYENKNEQVPAIKKVNASLGGIEKLHLSNHLINENA